MSRRSGGSHPRPGLPSVNLLSQSEFDRMAVRKLRQRFLVGGLALLVLIGAGWFFQHLRVNEAEKLLAVEQAQNSRLSDQAVGLTAIKNFVAGIGAQEKTVESTMAQEIYFSDVLSGIRSASPSGTTLQSVAVTLAPGAAGADAAAAEGATSPDAAGASVCPGPDPFQTETVIGCVTLSGTAVSRAQVGELVTKLAAINLFVEPFISTTTTDDGSAVTFSGSVGLSAHVYSLRYSEDPLAAAQTDEGTAESTTTETDATTAGGES